MKRETKTFEEERKSSNKKFAEFDSATELPVERLLKTEKTPNVSSVIARYCSIEANNEIQSITNRKISYDKTKIHSSLSHEEEKDSLLLQNIVTGNIITGKLWPILINDIPSENSTLEPRCLRYMKEKAKSDNFDINSLGNEQFMNMVVGIRDVWLANLRGLLNLEEKEMLQKFTEKIDDDKVMIGEWQGVSFSYCPSKNRQVIKYIEHIEELLDIDQIAFNLIAQVRIPSLLNPETTPEDENNCGDNNDINNNNSSNTSKHSSDVLYTVWVDARDLSYHNFESIIPLDRSFTNHKVNSSNNDNNENTAPSFQFSFEDITIPSSEFQVLKCKLRGSGCNLLRQLNDLELYQKPNNHSTRGGERFIFSSSYLSNALTTAIKSSNLLDNIVVKDESSSRRTRTRSRARSSDTSTSALSQSFRFVNYVFRCNRFEIDDSKFELHHDTPYFDSTLSHISLYTLLIYMTAGHAGQGSVLSIYGDNNQQSTNDNMPRVSFDKMEEFDCILFDQKYEHEGQPFCDHQKIFLRTELIFHVPNLQRSPNIGKLFSSAVYMTVESSFQPSLSQHAHALYESVNAAHWGKSLSSSSSDASAITSPVLLHKSWNDIHFAVNGFDYWFPFQTTNSLKRSTSSSNDESSNDDQGGRNNISGDEPLRFLKLAAIIAVFDYFNCNLPSLLSSNRSKLLEIPSLFNSFRKQTSSQPLPSLSSSSSPTEIFNALWRFTVASSSTSSSLFNVDNLGDNILIIDSTSTEKLKWFNANVKEYRSNEGIEQACCPFHSSFGRENEDEEDDMEDEKWFPWYDDYVLFDYEETLKNAEEALCNSPVCLLGNDIHIDFKNIYVVDDKIIISGGNTPPRRINFAACWNGFTTADFIGVQARAYAPVLLVPPISFVTYPATAAAEGDHCGDDMCTPGVRLMFDFFANNWILPSSSQLQNEIEIPNLEGWP